MIIADHVSRQFRGGSVTALSDISFCVREGETVGIIGKNGVGKTTLLKIIAGILRPSQGTVWTFGKEACEALGKNKMDIGCLFTAHKQPLPARTIREACACQQILYHIPEKEYKEMLTTVGNSLGIGSFIDVPLGRLSTGEKRRGEFLAAVLHRPRLLLLDEPTIGMDEENKHIFNEAIRYLNQTLGMTILTSSHDLQSLEQTSERVLLLQEGRLTFDGRWELLRQKAASWRCVVFYSETPVDLEDVPVHIMRYENGRTELTFRPSVLDTQVLEQFLQKRAGIRDYEVKDMETEAIVYDILRGGVEL